MQGTGGGDLGDVLLMPVVEGRNWAWDAGVPQTLAQEQITELGLDSGWVFDKAVPGYRSFFTHERETARAGYYGVHLLTPDVQAELTATTRCGMHRYSYPQLPGDTKQGVLLDLVHGIGSKVYHAELKIESATRISGMRATHGWAEDKQAYFVMEFSQPLTSIDASVDGTVSAVSPGSEFKGTEIKAMLAHAPGAPLVIRVGISCTSVEGAAKNLAAEMSHWDFDAVAREAGSEWSKALGVLDARAAHQGAHRDVLQRRLSRPRSSGHIQ